DGWIDAGSSCDAGGPRIVVAGIVAALRRRGLWQELGTTAPGPVRGEPIILSAPMAQDDSEVAAGHGPPPPAAPGIGPPFWSGGRVVLLSCGVFIDSAAPTGESPPPDRTLVYIASEADHASWSVCRRRWWTRPGRR